MRCGIFVQEPPSTAVVDAIYTVADVLNVHEVWILEGRFHLLLEGGWSIALSSDSAERIRVETCHHGVPEGVCSWTRAHDRLRLVELTERMSRIAETV